MSKYHLYKNLRQVTRRDVRAVVELTNKSLLFPLHRWNLEAVWNTLTDESLTIYTDKCTLNVVATIIEVF